MLPPLLKDSFTAPIIKMDDVYATGILATEIGVKRLHSGFMMDHSVPLVNGNGK